METIKDKAKITHQSPTIQYNDKAIKELKWNKKHSKRKRIEVKFKNGPKAISLRWTPKTNKKVFTLSFRFREKTYRHNCGEFLPGSYVCNDLDKYLIKLNEKHRNEDGSFKTNPNVDVITKAELKLSLIHISEPTRPY